ncbi:hypothetical protein EV383_5448 [Pseudonocardia sediminis]|uniref:DUF3592 domain-containing protein n=1 Tax=Pseudonocardia sediminis TaxID=1397368 RepID=A0A4Q7V311_PSEST|nr:DUF3592 domain-containing protein [Pseudonocardia sediminis]RZT88505.1 hypothetical protein EV383_5448 [Pseudonocardia sediminis]
MTSPASDVLAESRATAARLLRAARRRIPEILIGLGVVLTVLAVLALAGAFVDDVRIASNRATTAASVLDGSTYWRTVVQFVDDQGGLRTPAVYYPAGLEAGQSIYVEYDTTNPLRVRVAGRSAVDGILPMAGGLVVLWLVLAPVIVWLRRRRAAA